MSLIEHTAEMISTMNSLDALGIAYRIDVDDEGNSSIYLYPQHI